MAKKKRDSLAARLGHAVSDIANVASVAATGSEIGVLELAAEDELAPRPDPRPRKTRTTSKKTAPGKSCRPAGSKRVARRRKR